MRRQLATGARRGAGGTPADAPATARPRRTGCCGGRASGPRPGAAPPSPAPAPPPPRSRRPGPRAPPGRAAPVSGGGGGRGGGGVGGRRRGVGGGSRGAPADRDGHDHLWWLDRMVRSNQPLVERMTLIFHDWFANSNDKVDQQSAMLAQNALIRQHALGSFADLFAAITVDPAMLIFLDGVNNQAGDV